MFKNIGLQYIATTWAIIAINSKKLPYVVDLDFQNEYSRLTVIPDFDTSWTWVGGDSSDGFNTGWADFFLCKI